MNMEINTIQTKKMKDGLYIQKILKQLKLPQTGIYGYITQLIKHLVSMIKNFYGKKNIWKIKQAHLDHLSQLELQKKVLKKNMKLGNNLLTITILFFISSNFLYSEQRITTTPLLNIEEIKPSFEDLEEKNENIISKKRLKEKKNVKNIKSSQAVLIGLDKITAKSSELIVNLNESKRFGPLEIKILKCGKVKVNNSIDSVAYMQVKDLTKSENEQVFIFNGWTFASDPSLTPFDHAIYDLQLLNCFSA